MSLLRVAALGLLPLLPSTALAEELPNIFVDVTLVHGDACGESSSTRAVLKNDSITNKEVNAWICLYDNKKQSWESWFMTKLKYGEENRGAYVCDGAGQYQIQVCTPVDYFCPMPC